MKIGVFGLHKCRPLALSESRVFSGNRALSGNRAFSEPVVLSGAGGSRE